MRARVVVLEALAVRADDRLPDVARQDEELLQLRQDVRDGLVVLDHERRRVGRRQLRRMREERRERRRRRLGVLEDQVARPRAVVGGQRLPVRPLAARLEVERPRQAVLRRRPVLRPVTLDLELRVVLHERRIDVREDDVRERAERDERVHRVELVDRAGAHQAAVRLRLLRCGRRGWNRGRERQDAEDGETEQPASGHAISCNTGRRRRRLPPERGGYALYGRPTEVRARRRRGTPA